MRKQTTRDVHSDTIAAVSSGRSGTRVIVRMSGPGTVSACRRIFRPRLERRGRRLSVGEVVVDEDLSIEARLYFFAGPHSYTGEDVAELHMDAGGPVAEAVIEHLLRLGLRAAEPGEFTSRAYLNGKLDLTQAEAVNEVIMSSNALQLAAAEKLLEGRLSEATGELLSAILECLSRIEAGLDFSGEDIEFITRSEALERLSSIKGQLARLLSGSISYESVMELPAVCIAGAPNVGKSSLLNRLLGRERSIVSDVRRTTRDVLSGVLNLQAGRCVLFDCAGLVVSPDGILDELAQAAAIEAIRRSAVVLFCVDVSRVDWEEDLSVRGLVDADRLAAVATKADLVGEEELPGRLDEMERLFGMEFSAVSSRTGAGCDLLRGQVAAHLAALAGRSAGRGGALPSSEAQDMIALTARHRHSVAEAINAVEQCLAEIEAGNDEVAAMMLRASYQLVSDIRQQHVDDQILEHLFKNFCIGK